MERPSTRQTRKNKVKSKSDTLTAKTSISKKSKRGYTFFGCDNWPECNFMTWDKPTSEKCPNCGKSLFKGKGGILSCLDEKCGYKAKETRKKKSEA